MRPSRLLRRLARHLARFRDDRGGTISMEYVILTPIMLFAIAGTFGYYEAFRSFNAHSKVAFTVNDIASRYSSVDDTDMAYLYDLTNKMLPNALDQVVLRITSICFAGGSYKVMWSVVSQDTTATSFIPLTTDMIQLDLMPTLEEQESVILTESQARWTPFSTFYGLVSQNWTNRLVIRPRFVRMIPHVTLNDSNICPA